MIASMLSFITTNWLYLTITALTLAVIVLALILVDREHSHDDLIAFLKTGGKKVGASLLHWTWTKSFLFWLILSAGTFSELAFLLASTWMSVNAAEHSFVLLFMNEVQSEHVGYFARSAYVILPVFILPLGVTTTLTHLRSWRYTRTFLHPSGIWFALYLLPTFTFLVIDVCIIGNSNTEHYVLPDLLVTFRSIMAYTYGLIAIIYYYIGKQQEVDRLQEKDTIIDQLRQDNAVSLATLVREKDTIIMALRRETESQKELLAEYKNAHKQLLNAANKSDETALQGYSEECVNWLKSGVKSVTFEDITRYTGHSKRKIDAAITKGSLQKSTRNEKLILVTSLVEWLKSTPAPVVKEEPKILQFPSEKEPSTDPLLKAERAEMAEQSSGNYENLADKLQLTLDILGVNPGITDEQLAEELELKRPASARFWRLKAEEILAMQASEKEPAHAR